MNYYNTTRRTPPRKQLPMEDYKITKESGHHNRHNCPCVEVTDSGNAYRDVIAERIDNDKEHKWDKIRFYHQADIVKKNAEVVEVDTHGYGNSSTTRERINRELPKGFRVAQRDYSVKLKLPNGGLVDVPENFQIIPGSREVVNAENQQLICHYVRTT